MNFIPSKEAPIRHKKLILGAMSECKNFRNKFFDSDSVSFIACADSANIKAVFSFLKPFVYDKSISSVILLGDANIVTREAILEFVSPQD